MMQTVLIVPNPGLLVDLKEKRTTGIMSCLAKDSQHLCTLWMICCTANGTIIQVLCPVFCGCGFELLSDCPRTSIEMLPSITFFRRKRVRKR